MKTLISVLLCLFVSGCSVIMSGKDVEEHIAIMKQQNPMGCAYIKGNGTPPAARVDGGAAGAWGDGMDADQMKACLETLKGLP